MVRFIYLIFYQRIFIKKIKRFNHLLGDVIEFGNEKVIALATPGHTNGCMSYVNHSGKFVITGDALLIRGCGRTDFQQGSAERLYDSIHTKIFTLPDEYTIFPGHDYKGLRRLL